MASDRVTIQGDKQLIRRLERLSKPSRVRAAARGALGEGAKSMNRSLKNAVPAGSTGTRRIVGDGDDVRESDLFKGIKKSIGRRKKTYGTDNVVHESIGPRFLHQHTADGVTFSPSREAPSVEEGTIEHAPVPFMRRGFMQGVRESNKAIADSLGKNIEKQAAKG